MKILVTGSSGFIGGHLVRRLRSEGHFVVGADLVEPLYSMPDEFHLCDLRNPVTVFDIFNRGKFDEVYNLACLMGGMGFIGDPAHNFDVMVGSSQIVINVLDCAIRTGVKKIFYSSSACVYNQKLQDGSDRTNLAYPGSYLGKFNPSLKETDAYPAWPDLVYGWQKLFSEQLHIAAKDRIDIRIARFHNIYGPEGTYEGGKEKAPAAMCRKVITAPLKQYHEPKFRTITAGLGSVIDVWGTGEQTRSFLYIDDCIDAVLLLMKSDFKEPINIGSEESISINGLAQMAIDIKASKYRHTIRNIDGPVGVHGRNSDNTLIRKVLNWEPKIKLKVGMEVLYNWIKSRYETNV